MGYHVAWIYNLQATPAFQELIDHYHNIRTEGIVAIKEKIELAAHDTLDEVHRRVVEDPEAISNKDLSRMMVELLDRAGHAPVRKQISLHAGLSPATLARIKEETPIVDVTPKNPASLEVGVGEGGNGGARVQTKEIEGESSPGDSLSEEGGEGAEATSLGGASEREMDTVSR